MVAFYANTTRVSSPASLHSGQRTQDSATKVGGDVAQSQERQEMPAGSGRRIGQRKKRGLKADSENSDGLEGSRACGVPPRLHPHPSQARPHQVGAHLPDNSWWVCLSRTARLLTEPGVLQKHCLLGCYFQKKDKGRVLQIWSQKRLEHVLHVSMSGPPCHWSFPEAGLQERLVDFVSQVNEGDNTGAGGDHRGDILSPSQIHLDSILRNIFT